MLRRRESDGKGLGVVRSVAALRARIAGWRRDGLSVGLVPTMGALHGGHLSLIRVSRTLAERTCATVFVNPRQFAPHEDLARYPRDEAADAALLAREGTDLLFAPPLEVVYPAGFSTTVAVPGLGDVLEGAHRPGFFSGVATVVTKLLIQALPDTVVLGEKDFQQLLVVRRLVKDLDIPVAIATGPTVREADGLALSSRNAYLSAADRERAPALHAVLVETAGRIAAGEDVARAEARAADHLRHAGFERVDYVAAREAETLGDYDPAHPGRLLAAARLGGTRLIDNVAIPNVAIPQRP